MLSCVYTMLYSSQISYTASDTIIALLEWHARCKDTTISKVAGEQTEGSREVNARLNCRHSNRDEQLFTLFPLYSALNATVTALLYLVRLQWHSVVSWPPD